MDFKTASKLGSLLSKDYAEGMFELLVNYRDISSSEAASRLNLHVHTAQEFLEGLASLDVATKEEVSEGTRPYFRYSLKQRRLTLDIDLAAVRRVLPEGETGRRIREHRDSGARFSTARSGRCISGVTVWEGEGRARKERRISPTAPQGRFLYHLPFPDAEPLTVAEIMRRANIEQALLAEILDIVELLKTHGVIEAEDQ